MLDWPANSPDLNPIENLRGVVKRKMRDIRPNNADDLKAAIKATWASVIPQQCHFSETLNLKLNLMISDSIFLYFCKIFFFFTLV